jgi:hypothetical protein
MKPRFQFIADSTAPMVVSGTATWTYTVQVRGEDVEQQLSVHLESFTDAHQLDALLEHAFKLGMREGDWRVIRAVENAMQEYQ